MRLLHATDLHYRRKLFDWVYQQRKAYDAICLTGDFLNTASRTHTPIEQSCWVADWLNAFDDTPLFICSGNHDAVAAVDIDQLSIDALFAGYDDEYPDDCDTPTDDEPDFHWLRDISNPLVHSDASVTDLGGTTIGCIPYGSDAFADYAECEVLLYHIPPRGTPQAMQGQTDMGCERIRLQLDEGLLTPAWLLSGHVHKPEHTRSRVVNTWVVNPGAAGSGDVPQHKEITI